MMREISCCFAGYLPLSLKVGGRRAGDNSPGGNGCGILVLTLVSCCRSPSSGMPRGATSRKSITQLLFLRMSWTSITPPLQRDRVRAGHRLLLQQPLPYSWGALGPGPVQCGKGCCGRSPVVVGPWSGWRGRKCCCPALGHALGQPRQGWCGTQAALGGAW